MFNMFKRRLHDVRTLARLCTSAQALARQQGRPKPGSEHFILAALGLPDQTAARAFAALGLNEQRFRDALMAQRVDALASIGIAPVVTDVDRQLNAPMQMPMPPQPLLYEAEPSGQALVKRLADTRHARALRVLLGADVLLAAAQAQHTSSLRAFQTLGVDARRLAEAAELAIQGVVAEPVDA